ncbi:MAG: ABC transporter ATP-binding protein [Proteobacteria bacterium]|nr:ABC transporter ATP-binding protein [Pseudomonadota bacterium]
MGGSATPPVIDIAGVQKRYGHVVALADVSFSVARSEVVAIVGPSGCGKSTLLNIIAGFDEPTDGTVLVHGAPIVAPGPERSVVFQQPALFPWLNVRRNIVFGFSRARAARQSARVDEFIDIMGLRGFEASYPYQLSGGMMQRVSIARALIRDPEVLLMDEPFGALDAQTRLTMQELLHDVWARYAPTIVFITHDVDEAVFVSDRILVMSARPGLIRDVVEVPLKRPRSYELIMSEAFVDIKRRVLAELHA